MRSSTALILTLVPDTGHEASLRAKAERMTPNAPRGT
jgi:hypothetical protein